VVNPVTAGAVEQVGPVYPQVQLNPQFTAPFIQVWFTLVGEYVSEQDIPLQAGRVELQELAHAAFALLQVVSVVQPNAPAQVQVEEPPQEPAALDTDAPVVHVYWIALLQTPFTAQGALSLVQVRSLVQPLSPLQFQVADPPQLPATNEAHTPVEHAENIALLQTPLIGTMGAGGT
jgi:hypothetical protein